MKNILKDGSIDRKASVSTRLASGPGPGARAWPWHGSRVGAGWRSSHELFLVAGHRVEVFGRALGPGLALLAFGPGPGGRRGVGWRTVVWAWLVVSPLVFAGRPSVPAGMMIDTLIPKQIIGLTYFVHCKVTNQPTSHFRGFCSVYAACRTESFKRNTSHIKLFRFSRHTP